MVNRRSLSNREVGEVETLVQHLVEIGHGEMVTNPIRLLAVLEELTATVEPNTVQRVDEDEEGLTTYRYVVCLLYTSPSPRDRQKSRMPSSA